MIKQGKFKRLVEREKQLMDKLRYADEIKPLIIKLEK